MQNLNENGGSKLTDLRVYYDTEMYENAKLIVSVNSN